MGEQGAQAPWPLPLLLLKTVVRPDFPLIAHTFKVSFLACFILSTSPQRYSGKGEKLFLMRWAGGEKPMRDGVALSLLGIERRDSVDHAQALHFAPITSPCTMGLLLTIQWVLQSR